MPMQGDFATQVRQLISQGQSRRQAARALAHWAMDSQQQAAEGIAAAAAVACAEGFDDFAASLFNRLPSEAIAPEFVAARWLVELRLCSDEDLSQRLREAAPMLCGLEIDERIALLDVAASCGQLAALEALLELFDNDAGALEEKFQVTHARARAMLASIGVVQPLGPASLSHGATGRVLVVASLPPLDRPSVEAARRVVGDSPALRAESFIRSLQEAGATDEARWPLWRSLSFLDRFAGPRLTLMRLSAAEGHLPTLTRYALVVLPDGVLNQHSARHWAAALIHWPDVVVVGLQAHDPSAFTPTLIDALKRHQPIGVSDTSSQLLLAECGIACHVSGRTFPADQAKPKGARALWQDGSAAGPGNQALSRDVLAAFERPSSSLASDLRDALAARAQELREGGEDVSLPTAIPDCDIDLPGLLQRLRAHRMSVLKSNDDHRRIEVALTIDARLAEALPVVVESCLDHASQPLRFHVLTRGIDASQYGRWAALFRGRVGLDCYAFDEVDYGDELNLIGHTTVSTLDRLLLPLLLCELDRVIYLDVDLVVLGDLAELWNLNLDGHALAAKPSSSPGTYWGIQMLYQALGVLPLKQALPIRRWLHHTGPMIFRAFNAGVLLLDLARMRQDRAVPLLLSLVQHGAMNDQDALNAYTRGAYRSLDTLWNAAPRQDVTDGAKIIHFVGPVKPWHDTYISRKFEFQRVRDRVDQRRRELGLA